MTAQCPPQIPASGPDHPKLTITLLPLLDDGPAALAPEPGLNIGKVLLVETRSSWRNAFNETTVRTADDLLACAAQDGAYYDPMPKGADLLAVTLELYITGSAIAHRVELQPPDTLALHQPENADRILAFLNRREFASKPNS